MYHPPQSINIYHLTNWLTIFSYYPVFNLNIAHSVVAIYDQLLATYEYVWLVKVTLHSHKTK